MIRERDQFRDAAEMVPGGWKLVPTPVTEDMHVAAANVLVRANGLDGTPQRMLDAMLAAAPQPVITSDPLWPNDGVYPDMQPPATQRDRWMFDQGRLAERRIAARQPVGEVPMPDYSSSFAPRWPGDEGGYTSSQLRTYGDAREAAGYAAGVASGGKDAERLPMSYGGCNCACHRTPGVQHFVACCQPLGDAK